MNSSPKPTPTGFSFWTAPRPSSSSEQRAEDTLKSPLVEGTTAWSKGQVAYLPGAEMYVGGGGYQALVTVIDAMTAALEQADAAQ
ncbi:hypothetical protein PE067_01940 [Paracoccus sp. DMF-8]|uniref:hypothetical protein n=1 Tax=Paracoccus sp. DMF-8 TaxID=3019445 RepID=UPI0023E889B9|nr:hypothetical protein [Paracoccus sp. DMF-8]MDF3605027.1 hypothetical protein [Paracoccus sp. DMF-8]